MTRLPLTHVANCADCFAAATENPSAIGQTFNVVDSDDVRAWQYLGICIRRMRRHEWRIPVPYWLWMAGAHLARLTSRLLFHGRGKLPGILIPLRVAARFKPLRYSTARLRDVLGWPRRWTSSSAWPVRMAPAASPMWRRPGRSRRRCRMAERPVLAYLTGFYPHAADTFIRNEVRELRRLGFTVHTFSVRRPPPDMIVGEDVRREAKQTHYLLSSVPKLLLGGLVAMLCSPMRLLRAARLCYSSANKGVRARIWQTAYLLEAILLARLLRQLGVQHLHNHIGENSATVAMLASQLSGIPFSMTVHGPGDFDRPITIDLGRKVMHSVFTVAISNYGRSQLWRWCGHEHWNKVQVIRCGLDERFLAHDPPPVPNVPRFLCIGRLAEQKGQLLLVEAAQILAREGRRFEIVLIGDGPMRSEIQSFIEKNNLPDMVKLAGWMTSDRVREEILASRAVVLPSFAEGLPVVIMEALALGRPVISTSIAGIPELLEDGKSGWLVPAGSLDALLSAMRGARCVAGCVDGDGVPWPASCSHAPRPADGSRKTGFALRRCVPGASCP